MTAQNPALAPSNWFLFHYNATGRENLTERVVLDVAAVAGDPGAFGHGAAIVPAEAGPVYADKLISYGTKTLHVWVNITEVTAPNPATAPKSWFLWHTNSSGNHNITASSDTEKHGFETREHYWALPVDDNGMDSPYADGSRWTFKLGGSVTTPAISCYTGCADWFAKYSIVAHATNEVLPFEMYHYTCLRDEECPAPTA